ncbi:MAG: flagellar biosynthetic protein FliR [Acidobacteriota bacterium]
MTTVTVDLMELLPLLRAGLRAITLLAFLPWPSGRAIPIPVRALLGLMLGPLMWLPHSGAPLPELATPEDFLVALLGDLMVGGGAGLSVRIVLAAVQAASGLHGLQMGLSLSAVADPETGNQEVVLGRLQYWMTLALGIALGWHRHVFLALSEIFRLDARPRLEGFAWLVTLGEQVFSLGIRLAAPVMVCLLVTDLVVAITGRLVPQVKSLMLIHPIKILVGLIVFVASLPVLVPVVLHELHVLPESWVLLVERR